MKITDKQKKVILNNLDVLENWQLEEMKSYIEYLRQNGMPQAKWYEASNETHKS